MKRFEIPKSNWKSIPLDSAVFILNEAKEYLGYTIKEAESITKRSYSLVLLLATLLSAIVGYTFNSMVDGNFNSIIYMNFYFTFIIVVILLYLATLVFPTNIMAQGRKPIELAREEFLKNPNFSPQENYLSFVIQEIENLQYKIDFNLSRNSKRLNRLKYVMYSIVILLPIYLVIALLLV